MLIISLSSIPPRLDGLGQTLDSLLAQSVPADRIVLYLPWRYRRFPDWDGRLPEVPRGVEIRRVEQDLGPATKVLPAAREFDGQDCDILFCDDDRVYGRDWARRFLDAKARHPGCCIAQSGLEAHWLSPGGNGREFQPRAVRRWRITDVGFQIRYWLLALRAGVRRDDLPAPPRRAFKRSGYIDIFEGGHGVLVRPEHFDDTDWRIPPVLWSVDDVWLSGMVARKGVPIWLDGEALDPLDADSWTFAPLLDAVIEGADRRAANAATVEYMRATHGIWL